MDSKWPGVIYYGNHWCWLESRETKRLKYRFARFSRDMICNTIVYGNVLRGRLAGEAWGLLKRFVVQLKFDWTTGGGLTGSCLSREKILFPENPVIDRYGSVMSHGLEF